MVGAEQGRSHDVRALFDTSIDENQQEEAFAMKAVEHEKRIWGGRYKMMLGSSQWEEGADRSVGYAWPDKNGRVEPRLHRGDPGWRIHPGRCVCDGARISDLGRPR